MSDQVIPRVETPSGLPLEPVYGPGDRAADPPPPGVYPFTRGKVASGYRAKTWTFRQYSGFGTAEESNKRYRYLLGQGGTGLSVALDLPTQCGYDSDDEEYGEEVGRVGVAVDTLADAEVLFDGIPLDKISTSFTINGTAVILLAFYVAAADKAGVPRAKLTGTIQNDIAGAVAASDRRHHRVLRGRGAEVQCDLRGGRPLPRRRRQRRSGDGVHPGRRRHLLRHRRRTRSDDHRQVRPQISFFFYTHGDFFEEIAKYRAGRRRWATIVRERSGATTDKASKHGGMVRSIEDGYLHGLIADEGEGRARRRRREGNPCRLSRAADGTTDNLVHRLVDCANAYCTVGEMVTALKAVWGEFQQPVVF